MKTDPPKAVDALWKVLNSTHKNLRIQERKNEQLQEQIDEYEEEISEIKEDNKDNIQQMMKQKMETLETEKENTALKQQLEKIKNELNTILT